MTEELIKRLRKWAKSDLGLIVMYEAADTIEAQAAEIKRLQDALIRASRDIQGYKDALAQVGEDW
jgi:hypothetical protein